MNRLALIGIVSAGAGALLYKAFQSVLTGEDSGEREKRSIQFKNHHRGMPSFIRNVMLDGHCIAEPELTCCSVKNE